MSEVKSELDEIDRLLQAYQQPAEGGTAKPDLNNPIQNSIPVSESKPFITHEQHTAKQEYYQRGAKKGQPKPPKKGTAPPLNPAGQLSIQATVFITGAIFITLVDLLLPLAITGIYNWINSKKKDGVLLDYEKMKMTPSQRSDLAPVGDAVVRELKLNGSPTLLFLLGLVGVYFMNFILNKSKAEKDLMLKQAKEKQNEKNNSSASQINGGANPTPGYTQGIRH